MEMAEEKGSLVKPGTPPEAGRPPRAGRREWIGLAVVFLHRVPARAEFEGQKDVDASDTASIELDEQEVENAV